jgi:hypothetical protein
MDTAAAKTKMLEKQVKDERPAADLDMMKYLGDAFFNEYEAKGEQSNVKH